MAVRPNAPRQKVRPAFQLPFCVSRELHTALPCLPTCLAGTPLAALVGSRPSAPLRPAVPSRVEAQTRAEPSAGAQGPVLNEEAGLARPLAPQGLRWPNPLADPGDSVFLTWRESVLCGVLARGIVGV